MVSASRGHCGSMGSAGLWWHSIMLEPIEDTEVPVATRQLSSYCCLPSQAIPLPSIYISGSLAHQRGIYSPSVLLSQSGGKCNLTPLCLHVSGGQHCTQWNACEKHCSAEAALQIRCRLSSSTSFQFCRGRWEAWLTVYLIQTKWHQSEKLVLESRCNGFLAVGRIPSNSPLGEYELFKDTQQNPIGHAVSNCVHITKQSTRQNLQESSRGGHSSWMKMKWVCVWWVLNCFVFSFFFVFFYWSSQEMCH